MNFMLNTLPKIPLCALVCLTFAVSGCGEHAAGETPAAASAPASGKTGENTLQITADQAKEANVGPVESIAFEHKREATGYIDFNQESAVQVFTPYQGRIGTVRVKAGEDVRAGQVLYTVLIPDLPQAAATLISTAGILKQADETLERAKVLAEAKSIPLKELQQNISDQQAAEGNYQAALKVMTLFGLDPKDIKVIEDKHRLDNEMPVRSPIAGRVTSRAAAPGLLVQPGNAPAPVTVADINRLWMIANVPESELAAYHLGQAVSVHVQAYPDKTFKGEINYISDTVDPNVHRIALRAVIKDPEHLLRQQMLASFEISLGDATRTVAVPVNAVARETDGSFSVWIAKTPTVFTRRSVTPGIHQGDSVEILSGLKPGESIARDKALYLSNLYVTSGR
jgi:cobalt-zinc-cadmium efflux system membrane fusion protein